MRLATVSRIHFESLVFYSSNINIIFCLRSELSQEKHFRDVLLTTFSTFTSASGLFQLLVDRFEMECPSSLSQEEAIEWRDKKLRPVQKR